MKSKPAVWERIVTWATRVFLLAPVISLFSIWTRSLYTFGGRIADPTEADQILWGMTWKGYQSFWVIVAVLLGLTAIALSFSRKRNFGWIVSATSLAAFAIGLIRFLTIELGSTANYRLVIADGPFFLLIPFAVALLLSLAVPVSGYLRERAAKTPAGTGLPGPKEAPVKAVGDHHTRKKLLIGSAASLGAAVILSSIGAWLLASEGPVEKLVRQQWDAFHSSDWDAYRSLFVNPDEGIKLEEDGYTWTIPVVQVDSEPFVRQAQAHYREKNLSLKIDRIEQVTDYRGHPVGGLDLRRCIYHFEEEGGKAGSRYFDLAMMDGSGRWKLVQAFQDRWNGSSHPISGGSVAATVLAWAMFVLAFLSLLTAPVFFVRARRVPAAAPEHMELPQQVPMLVAGSASGGGGTGNSEEFGLDDLVEKNILLGKRRAAYTPAGIPGEAEDLEEFDLHCRVAQEVARSDPKVAYERLVKAAAIFDGLERKVAVSRFSTLKEKVSARLGSAPADTGSQAGKLVQEAGSLFKNDPAKAMHLLQQADGLLSRHDRMILQNRLVKGGIILGILVVVIIGIVIAAGGIGGHMLRKKADSAHNYAKMMMERMEAFNVNREDRARIGVKYDAGVRYMQSGKYEDATRYFEEVQTLGRELFSKDEWRR